MPVGDYQWVVWLAASVGLAAVEAATADFTFLMLAGGALAGAGSAAMGASFPVSAVIAVVVGLALVLFVRPALSQRFRPAHATDIGAAGLVGRSAQVLQEVTSDESGRVKLNGEIWSARSADERRYSAGETVQVVLIDGATAVVSAAPPALTQD